MRRWIGLGVVASLLGSVRGEVEEIYLDADDGGRHAVIGAALEGEAGQERLLVRIRPWGQGVEAEGGWRARAGFNAHTAREMEAVLRAKGFEARLRGEDGIAHPAQVAWTKEFGTFPRRSLREDWSIDYFARTEQLVSELSLQTTAPLGGHGVLELLARGEPRLLLEYDVGRKRVTGMRMPGHSETVPVAVLVAEQKVIVPIALPAGWSDLDREAKWAAVEKLVGDDVEKRGRLVEALRRSKDWMFLEQIALYSEGAFDTHGIGVILSQAKTNNWRRLAAWFAKSRGGHGGLHTQSLLGAPEAKAQTLGWFTQHEALLEPGLLALKKSWETAGVKPVAAENDLPPHTEDDVLALIDLAGKAREDPVSARQLRQIVRGIQGWAISQRWGSPWGQKVVDLIDDADWRIAESACLAFTNGKNQAVPMDPLWRVAQDEKKDQRLREAALLGWSYGSWGEVFVTLHEIAGKTDHPLFMPAVSRLGELGNGWTIVMLEEYALLRGAKGRRGRLTAGQRKLVKQEIEILKQRFAKGNFLSTEFESTAWAIVLRYDRSADMEEWLLSRYGDREFANDNSRKLLKSVRGWNGAVLGPKVKTERLEVRKRLIDELEFRWEKAEK